MLELYNRDCLIGLKQLPKNCVDAVITDPPYEITRNKWDKEIPLDELWTELRRVTKPNGAIVIFASQPFTSKLVMSNPREYRHSWVWRKSRVVGYLNAKKAPLRVTEDIIVFSQAKPNYYPQGLVLHEKYENQTKETSRNYGEVNEKIYYQKYTNYPKNVLEFKSVQKTDHPTQKPVELIEYLIRTYTKVGDTVLDYAFGSGTTVKACINTTRDFIGYEVDKNYYDLAFEKHVLYNN